MYLLRIRAYSYFIAKLLLHVSQLYTLSQEFDLGALS